jgi:hypothetical protein
MDDINPLDRARAEEGSSSAERAASVASDLTASATPCQSEGERQQ